MTLKLPAQGTPKAELLARMESLRAGDADWRNGKTFSLVYFAGDELLDLVKQASGLFFSENGLSPIAFPSLKRFEAEVLAMAADLFHGETAAGTLTSGGSESLLMAVKTARDWARAEKPQIKAPEMLVPVTAHPALLKAAHYFDVKPVRIPVGDGFAADVAAARALCNENTILIVGSAPAYPHGVLDPIGPLAALAQEKGLLCHVDACLGGFLLPWAERLGVPLPAWDFRVPGVTSLSADLHKYAFTAKGASVVLYRDEALRRHQFFAVADWPGGLYASPSMTGTRPGGAIAAAWAALNHLGAEGYLEISRTILDTAKVLREGVAATPGLRLLGDPLLSVFAFTADGLDIYALGDAMEARGWKLDRQQLPPSLHLMITPAHAAIAGQFLADLRACAAALLGGEEAPPGSAALYGMIGAMPDRSAAEPFLLEFLDSLYRFEEGSVP
jgi:glutamate/tyrosine decarboxylase-like PLP-dependent enzyme